jgi:hypothetical protein
MSNLFYMVHCFARMIREECTDQRVLNLVRRLEDRVTVIEKRRQCRCIS